MYEAPDHTPSVILEDVRAGYDPKSPVFCEFNVKLQGPGLFHLEGANGTGKSTFLELIAGYLRPWTGSVTVNGLPAHGADARRIRSVCRTRPSLYQDMTAHDHLFFAARAAGTRLADLLLRAEHYGLDPWLETGAAKLSTGNARKLWLIMCTRGDHGVTVLDEPFNELDEVGVHALMSEIDSWRRVGLVIVIAHHLHAGVAFDRVVALPDHRSVREVI